METSTQYSHNIHGLNQRFGPGTLVSPEDMLPLRCSILQSYGAIVAQVLIRIPIASLENQKLKR